MPRGHKAERPVPSRRERKNYPHRLSFRYSDEVECEVDKFIEKNTQWRKADIARAAIEDFFGLGLG